MKPPWNVYFMEMAYLAARRGSCDRKRVGAVIVRDRHVLATGYNGAPAGWPDCDTVGHQLVQMGDRESCIRTIHAEENAIIQAAIHGTGIRDATLFTTASPCYDCVKRISQVGITTIMYGEMYTSARSSGVDVLGLLHSIGIEAIHVDYLRAG